MSILIRNIGLLAGIYPKGHPVIRGREMAQVASLQDAWLLISGDRIAGFGAMTDLPDADAEQIDAAGGMVMPSFCDSHTHLVFAAPREQEFVDRIKGLSYQEIAARGGGILHSAARLADMPEELLLAQSLQRLEEVIQMGTGAIEIKSGYGLSRDAELKMLRVIRRMKEISPIPIKATFLGAHALPPAWQDNRAGYVQLLIDMLPQIADEGLADYIDVFCETNYFTPEETGRLLEAGNRLGMKGKVHVNQFTSIGGLQACVQHGALTVDHLEVMTDADLDTLAASDTLPVALPGCSFFIGIPYTPGRVIIDSGKPLVIASDYNPGSTPSGNMALMWSLACTQMKLLPEEAFHAITINGAHAMELQDEVGSIAIGKRANLLLTKPVPSLAYLPYAYGHNHWEKIWVSGKPVSPVR